MKNLEYAFKSYIGSQDRETSESFVHADNLFMVVDGFGIDSLADIVKEETCHIVPRAFFSHLSENKSPADALIYAVEEANKKILEERHKLGEKVAASICLIYFFNRIMYFTHLGDSRIYSFQAGELNQLTRDHTVREEDPLAEKKFADPRALNALTHGLGIHEKPAVKVKKYPVDKRCLILMTTTGLTERVSNRDIAWLSKKHRRPEEILRGLIDLDKRKGGNANLTAGIIKCGGLTKMMRKTLMIYAVFFIIIASAGAYALRYNSGGLETQKPEIAKPPTQEETQAPIKRPAEDKIPEETKKVVVVQPIIPEKEQEKTRQDSAQRAAQSQPLVEKPTAKKVAADSTPEAGIGPELLKTADNLVMEWKTAWEKTAGRNGDIDRYISFYSDKFESEGFNKDTWRIDKETKNKRKAWISIRISNLKITGPTRANRLEASFNMNYRSSTFNGSSRKVLDLVREGNTLKIIGERTY